MARVKYFVCAILLIYETIKCSTMVINETVDTLQVVTELQSNFDNGNCLYCNDDLKPIYLTPENVDEVLRRIRLPSMQTLKERKKPFSFIVEGIVGTGKTTLLSAFQVNNMHRLGQPIYILGMFLLDNISYMY